MYFSYFFSKIGDFFSLMSQTDYSLGNLTRRPELKGFGRIFRDLAKSGVGVGSGTQAERPEATEDAGQIPKDPAKSFQRRTERQAKLPRKLDLHDLDGFHVFLGSELNQFGRIGDTTCKNVL